MLPKTTHRLLKGLAAGDKNGGPSKLAHLLHNHVKQFGFSQQGVFNTYYNWVTTEGFDTGPTLERVCFYVQGGCSLQQAVEMTHWDMQQRTAGVGPAHRAVPLALFFSGTELDDIVYQEAQVSHFSPLAGETSIVAVRMCSYLLQGYSLREAIAHAGAGINGVSLQYLHLHQRTRGGFGPKVLQTAVSFLHDASSFAEALQTSLDFAGPNNYCPVLVGSIGACLFPTDEKDQAW